MKRFTISVRRPRPWWPYSTNGGSGKPGAVHLFYFICLLRGETSEDLVANFIIVQLMEAFLLFTPTLFAITQKIKIGNQINDTLPTEFTVGLFVLS